MKRVIAGLLSITFFLTGCSNKKKEEVPPELQALQNAFISGDGEVIYNLSVFSQNTFVNYDIFIEACKDTFIGDIIAGEINIAEVKLDSGGLLLTSIDGESFQLKGVGNSWVLNDLYLEPITLSALSGSEIELNGISVDESYITEEADNICFYEISSLMDIDNKIVIHNDLLVKDFEGTINSSATDYNFIMSEDDKTDIMKNLKNMIQTYYDSIQKGAASYLDVAYMFHSDLKKNDLKEMFSESVAMLNSDKTYSRYYDLKIEKLELTDDIIYLSTDTIQLPIHIITTWKIGDGSLIGRTENSTNIVLVKDQKKGWVILEIEDPTFINNLNYLKGVDE